MKFHLRSGSHCNIVKSIMSAFLYKEMTTGFRFTFSVQVGDANKGGLQLVLSETNRIGDTKYNGIFNPCRRVGVKTLLSRLSLSRGMPDFWWALIHYELPHPC